MSQLTLIKEGKNFKVYKDAKGQKYIKLERIRASYPAFGHAQENEDDEGKKALSWGGKGLMPKATHTEAKNALKELIQELIAENKVSIPSERWCLRDGDGEGRPEEEKGNFVVSFSNKKNRPTVRDQRAEVMDDLDKIDDKFYGGCWISVLIRPWYFDGKAKGSSKTHPKRISSGIQSVQFIKDDTPFGSGRVDDSDQWDAVDDEDDGLSSGSSSSDDGL